MNRLRNTKKVDLKKNFKKMKEGEGSEWRPGSLKTRGMYLRVNSISKQKHLFEKN